MRKGLSYHNRRSSVAQGASLNLNFVNGQTLDPRVTFTRASSATYFDSTGTLQTAATNVPRFDYNPSTKAAQGLLIEEQRTNSIRNNTMQGAVAGTPGTYPTNWAINNGGLSVNVIGTGIENGVTYIDLQFTGTPTATSANARFDSNTQIVAANGQTWTGSFYARQVGGTTNNIIDVYQTVFFRDAVGTILTQQQNTILTSLSATSIARNRQTSTFTAANASTAFVNNSVQLSLTIGVGPVDITLRIGLPQLELGAFATSVIPTTNAAATRSADVASINTLTPWYNSTASTIYAEWTPIASALGSGTSQIVTRIGDGTGNNFIALFQLGGSGNKASQNMFSGGVNPGRLDSGGAYSTATVKAAAAFAASDRAISANGAAATTSATGALPLTSTRMSLGIDDSLSVGSLNGYLRRITYYPRRLSNAELQSLTV